MMDTSIQNATKRIDKERGLKDPTAPKDAFSIHNLMKLGTDDLQHVQEGVAKVSTRSSSDSDDEYSSESNSSDSPKSTVTALRVALVRQMIASNVERMQQQSQEAISHTSYVLSYQHYDPVKKMNYTFDDGKACLIRPLYEDGSFGDARSITGADMRDIFGTGRRDRMVDFAPEVARLNVLSSKIEKTSKTLNTDMDIDVRVARNGKRFTLTDPFTQICGTDPVLIEKVKGKDYFVGNDGRHFQVKEGKAQYLEPETAESRLKLTQYNAQKMAYSITGQKSDDLRDDIQSTFGVSSKKPTPVEDFKKSAGETVDRAKKAVDDTVENGAKAVARATEATTSGAKAAAKSVSDTARDVADGTTKKFNEVSTAVTNSAPVKAVADGWKNTMSAIGFGR